MSDDELYARGDADGGGHLDVDEAGQQTTIVLHGEVDAAIGGLLEDLGARAVAAGYAVQLHVRAVSFMDSTAAAFLIRLAREVAPRRVRLLKPAPQVQHLLAVTGLSTLVDVSDD